MRAASSPPKADTSRNVSTWCSGMTRTCTGACGLMSLIATSPSAAWMWLPSRASLQKRQSSRCSGKDPLLGDAIGSDAHELADRRVDEPRRVVVAVASARAVDEHHVLDLRPPTLDAELVRERAQTGAALLLDACGHGIVG